MTSRYFRDQLLLQAWFVLVCTLLGGLGALTVSTFLPSRYSASALVRVDIPTTSITVLAYTGDEIATDVQLATSDPILTEVAAHYSGLDASVLSRDVSAAAVPNSNLFQITVVYANATEAAALANDVATALIEQQAQQALHDNYAAQQPTRDEMTSVQDQITQVQQQLAQLPPTSANNAQIAALQAQLTILRSQYTSLQATLASISLAQARNLTFLSIAQRADPKRATAQSPLLTGSAVGAACGLLLGLLVVAVWPRLGRRVRSTDAVERALDAPVLAQVGPLTDARGLMARSDPPALESYAALVKAFAFLTLDAPARLLVVAGATGDGVEHRFAADLGAFLASKGEQPLLIDADLRAGTQAQRFGLEGKSGLSDAVLQLSHADHDALQLNAFVYPIGAPGAGALHVMPAGTLPPNPDAVLRSPALRELFASVAKSQADLVMVDAPHSRSASIAGRLGRMTDGVLVVAELGRTRTEQLFRLRAALAAAGAKIVGAVIYRDAGSREAAPVRMSAPKELAGAAVRQGSAR